MDHRESIEKLIASRRPLVLEAEFSQPSSRKSEAEGGCGVIGIACSEKIPARHLLQALKQMRNRGNGKGGGIAAVGLVPEELGVSREVLENDYLLTIACLDPGVRPELEGQFIDPTFEVDHVRYVPHIADFRSLTGLEMQPPEVYQYFVRVRPEVTEAFRASHGLEGISRPHVEDEIVYQNSYRLNRAFYASTGDKRAFVLSHGKNLMVLKMVGYGDDVVRYYQLEDLHAHVWIGHHRYPTKGKVWHPGGAHPFVGLHEALVHNGDFANYASMCEYLAQRNIHPLFLTDTEVSVLVFDLLHRTYGYPLEYVIEALAPTTERDFTLLPSEKQRIYQMLQTVHIHGSPDGPWFFLIAQSDQKRGEGRGAGGGPPFPPILGGGPPFPPILGGGPPFPPILGGQGGAIRNSQCSPAYRLIGITDTSMLRPQVFALQEGSASIGFAASEKQAIDAALASLAGEDPRFWTRADRYWNARGGSHTDGGAFIFTVTVNEEGTAELVCTDKFGRPITADTARRPMGELRPFQDRPAVVAALAAPEGLKSLLPADELFAWVTERFPIWDYDDVLDFLTALERPAGQDCDRGRAIEVLTRLMDRRYPTGRMRRSSLLSLFDESFTAIVEGIRKSPSPAYVYVNADGPRPDPASEAQTVVIDGRGFAAEGEQSLALEIVRLYQRGWRRFLVAHARGHRFIANGLGHNTKGVRIDVYGSSGDYLASGIDGAEVFVHGNAQDQLAQIMKDGTLVVHGDVGQTFMYAAKGGKAFVLGNAAGRPLINAVGKPRVVINGTCLDYLAESFMAGDPLNGGGFVILNGITFDDDGEITELDTPYPGGNLFSLASGGAIYLRDPRGRVSEEQLNGGEFAELGEADWAVIKPYLEENERLFGIPLDRLLEVNGRRLPPAQVYRKIRPRAIRALQAEEAWVQKNE